MKAKTKRILKYVGLALVAIIALGALIHVTGIGDKKTDSKNLIDVESDDYIISQDTGYAVKIDVDEDSGEITLKGTASSALDVKVTSLELAAGTYKISGLDECTKNGFNMHVKSGSNIIAYSGIEDTKSNAVSDTFTLAEDTTVTVWISWPNEHEFTTLLKPFGTKILPVISEVKSVETAE